MNINSHMRSSRYGVELAYALITESFFIHNENLRAKKENRCALPIIAYECNGPTSVEKFGLLTNTVPSACQSFQLQSKVKMRDLRHDEIQEALQSMDITLPLLETVQHDGIDLTEDEVLSILTQAISAYFVTITLKSLTTTADFQCLFQRRYYCIIMAWSILFECKKQWLCCGNCLCCRHHTYDRHVLNRSEYSDWHA